MVCIFFFLLFDLANHYITFIIVLITAVSSPSQKGGGAKEEVTVKHKKTPVERLQGAKFRILNEMVLFVAINLLLIWSFLVLLLLLLLLLYITFLSILPAYIYSKLI